MKIEKQERIINAAMKEFIKSGYDKASTNEMVKDAQISKGSLFNYFSSKKDLYLFLIQNTVNIIEEIYVEIDMTERDIFERISQVGFIKLNIQKKYPLVFDFLKSLLEEDAQEVKSDINQLLANIQRDGMKRIYENIDWSKLREDIDPEKAMNILNWTMAGFAELQIAKIKSFEHVRVELFNEWDRYREILKRSFYKNGEE
ncbi:TetR family transcriptional regulator [Sporosarcina globispora]|uniref:TetR family transcriptional regulator n=1 Tax=Sporosarcina globispora TaxID=1459 RepID=A0A0M0GEG7_SPOGL|nr:TetR/AcrR family transcriptional regulator [Sporosarcina globispora]KON88158.1 TetR family transcriptional regulator [Sporosarcina globispora]